jgi:hypothetical protein
MTDRRAVRERYLRDNLPVRLGGLAANLRRIASFSRQPANHAAVESLFDESKHFIEWTAAEADIDTAAQLVELQVQLARWQRNWPRIGIDSEHRQQLSEQALAWSDRVLGLSGLLA